MHKLERNFETSAKYCLLVCKKQALSVKVVRWRNRIQTIDKQQQTATTTTNNHTMSTTTKATTTATSTVMSLKNSHHHHCSTVQNKK